MGAEELLEIELNMTLAGVFIDLLAIKSIVNFVFCFLLFSLHKPNEYQQKEDTKQPVIDAVD